MDFAEQLRILEAAQGSPALLALATVDIAHHALPVGERSRIKDALLAAAVPHWCDRDFLAALLETTLAEGDRLLAQLHMLTVIEPFPARGEYAVNVHEAARLALRNHLGVSDAARWKAFSTIARAYVSRSREPHARIEALYHLFATDQAAAAQECEALDREITQGGRPEVRHALALALRELTTAGWLSGAAEVEALLPPLEARSDRGEVAQLEPDARKVVDLARKASHWSGIGRAHGLLGDVLASRGQFDEASRAFHEYLAIFQRLCSAQPSNAGWQRDLAIAYAKVGDVSRAQGRRDDALVDFRETLAIFQRLAADHPSNAGWQRDLAVAHSRIGDMYHAQEQLDDALAAFSEHLAILDRLVSAEPTNAGWQRELAVSHMKMGDVHQAQHRFDDALDDYLLNLAISERLATDDPSNALWQRDLAVAYSRVGEIYQAQGRLDEALAASQEYLAISQRLASADPFNAEYQRGLAVAHNQLAWCFKIRGDAGETQSNFRSAVETMERAVAMAQGNVSWEQDLANLKRWATSDDSQA